MMRMDTLKKPTSVFFGRRELGETMNRTRVLWIGLVIISIVVGWLKWTERTTQVDLQQRLSSWTNRDTTIEYLSLGMFESEIMGVIVRTQNATSVINDVEIESITIGYDPTDFGGDDPTLERLNIDRLTIHWDGLLGRNIQQIIGEMTSTAPKARRSRRTISSSSSTLQIKVVQLTNTTIVVHIGNNTESIQLLDLELNNLDGTHHNILKQILEQIHSAMKEDRDR